MHAAGGHGAVEREETFISGGRGLTFCLPFSLFGPIALVKNCKQATSLQLRNSNIFEPGLTTAFLITLVKAVGESVALPPSWDTFPIGTHEVSRNVALCGDVVAWQQLAF